MRFVKVHFDLFCNLSQRLSSSVLSLVVLCLIKQLISDSHLSRFQIEGEIEECHQHLDLYLYFGVYKCDTCQPQLTDVYVKIISIWKCVKLSIDLFILGFLNTITVCISLPTLEWMNKLSDQTENVKICLEDWVHPVQIYTEFLSKLNRACHPQAIFHLLPTSTIVKQSPGQTQTQTDTTECTWWPRSSD